MFYIIYNTSTKFICAAGNDTSTPVSNTLQNIFASHIRLNRLNTNEFNVAEVQVDEGFEVVLGRDMFNADTSTIYADPNWVAPAPSEPTA